MSSVLLLLHLEYDVAPHLVSRINICQINLLKLQFKSTYFLFNSSCYLCLSASWVKSRVAILDHRRPQNAPAHLPNAISQCSPPQAKGQVLVPWTESSLASIRAIYLTGPQCTSPSQKEMQTKAQFQNQFLFQNRSHFCHQKWPPLSSTPKLCFYWLYIL